MEPKHDRTLKQRILGQAVHRVPQSKIEAPSRSGSPLPGKPAETPTARWQSRLHAFPATLNDFRQHPPYAFSRSLASELVQAVTAAEYFSPEINAFVKSQQVFEQDLLVRSLPEASKTLRLIERNLGKSIWHVEASVIVAERRGGLESIREHLATILDTTTNRSILFPAHWFSRRAEPAISANSYDDIVSSMLNDARGTRRIADAINYTSLRINHHRESDFNNLGYYLWRESQLSAVDYYLALLRTLQFILIAGRRHEGWSNVSGIVARLSSHIDDRRLRGLVAISSLSPLTMTSADLEAMQAIDAYSSGHYSTAAGRADAYVNLDPACIPLYELHARSAVAGRLEPTNPFAEGTLANSIYRHMFEVTNKTDHATDSLNWLLKTSYVCDGLPLGLQLFAFVQKESGTLEPHLPAHVAAVGSVIVTPQLADALPSDEAERLIDAFREQLPQSSTIRLFAREQPTAEELERNYPLERRLTYYARRLERDGEHLAAADVYAKLHEVAEGRATFEADAAIGRFRCLSAAGFYDAAASHTVDVYLRRRSLLISVRVENLLRQYESKGDARPAGSIDWPILYHIYYHENRLTRDSYRVFVSYDEFLECHAADRPSALAKIEDRFPRGKLVFFLRHICVHEVMDNAPLAFASSAEIDAERIAICQLLLKLDPDSSAQTQREIVDLTTQSMIRRAVRDVSERKVHVDVVGIRESLGSVLREKFDRFVANAQLSDERLRRVWAVGDRLVTGDVFVREVNVQDEAFRAFWEIFQDIKTQFLWSPEHGLNFYLSVRIRHGTLAGQLRRRFQSAHLVTTKDQSGLYEPNYHWREQFELWSTGDFEPVDKRLQFFSREIDDVIERVRSKWIQIRAPANDNQGLFNFDFTLDEVASMFVTAKDIRLYEFESFVEQILTVLWHRTDEQLARVRKKLSVELKAELISLLDQLEADVGEMPSQSKHPLLVNAITQCRTEIQNEMELIAGWFNLVDQTDIPNFGLSLVFDTGMEIIKGLHPTREMATRVDVNDNIQCVGRTFLHFVDVIQIMLENVVRHAGTSQPRAVVSARRHQEHLVIEVRNPLAPDVQANTVRQKISALQARSYSVTQQAASVVAGEGGTGYFKLLNLLRVGLQRNDSSVTFEVSSEGEFIARISMELQGISV